MMMINEAYAHRLRRLAAGVLMAAWLARAGAVPAATVEGITEPLHDLVISASVPGTIAKILVKEGDFMESGTAILELEKRQEELEVERRRILSESKAELTAAAAQMEMLKMDLEATRKLFETSKSVSKEQLLKKELEYKQAVAEHDKLQLAEAREKIEYEMALEQLRKRVITAPQSGYVVELMRKAGEDCKAQEPLVRLVDTRQCYFVANVEARAGAALAAGQRIKLELPAGRQSLSVTGEVAFVSPVVDPASGLLKVKVLFENPQGKIRPGVAGLMHLPEAP
ncbi:MAG: efflux RND transporter periplasmic adaptor subunit [Verrucomicrobiae bacterium]|nr:efflux RND transporter periplasmic adaptor subunit [Verrucomicrobiae bacterium]